MVIPPKSKGQRHQDLVTEVLGEVDADQITVELVTPEEEAKWNKLIRRHHYLKEHRMVGESLRYVAKRNGEWIALLGWSSAAYHLGPRDQSIGWTELQRKARRHWVICNSRFVMLSSKFKNEHLASQILSLNLNRVCEDWQNHYQHPVVLAETFVDPERFEGTCYRAANWIEIGVSKGFGRSRLDFYQLHEHPKSIFLYPLRRDAKALLSAPVLPEGWAAYERNRDPKSYPLSNRQTKSLLETFKVLRDPRRYRGWRHRQVCSILAIAVAAMIANNNSYLDIGAFARSLNQNQLRALRASRDRKTGKFVAPSEKTIRRVIQRMDPEQLDEVVADWLRSHIGDVNIAALAVDGKCVRTASKMTGKSIQLFSALDVQTRIVSGQIQIPAKTNEIPALQDLLGAMDLRGTLITLDALHTQKKTAAFLVEEKQADYLLSVKANQPKIFNNLTKLARAQQGVFFPSTHHDEPGTRST